MINGGSGGLIPTDMAELPAKPGQAKAWLGLRTTTSLRGLHVTVR